jgi:hypothetical protein
MSCNTMLGLKSACSIPSGSGTMFVPIADHTSTIAQGRRDINNSISVVPIYF